MTTLPTPFEPGRLAAAAELADRLAQSQFVPTAFRGKPSDVLSAVLYGLELGLGPLPALSTPGVTDTVRRYSSMTGLTASDATGGVVQSYSRRCDVADGQSGGGWSVWPVETLSSVSNGDQLFWHTICETTTPELFSPAFGAYDGASFFDGSQDIGLLSSVGAGAGGQFRWEKRHLGTGPNGGTLIECWVSQVLTQSKSNVTARAYLLSTVTGGNPARTLYIHNHTCVRLPNGHGMMVGWPTWLLVGAGATPALAAEQLEVTAGAVPLTILMRVDFRALPSPLPYAAAYFGAFDSWNSAWYASDASLRWYPPSIDAAGVLSNSLVTVGLLVTSDRRSGHARNGDIVLSPSTIAANPLPSTFQVGRIAAGNYHLNPIRRAQVWSRVLTAAEIAAAHAAIVAAEGGA